MLKFKSAKIIWTLKINKVNSASLPTYISPMLCNILILVYRKDVIQLTFPIKLGHNNDMLCSKRAIQRQVMYQIICHII